MMRSRVFVDENIGCDPECKKSELFRKMSFISFMRPSHELHALERSHISCFAFQFVQASTHGLICARKSLSNLFHRKTNRQKGQESALRPQGRVSSILSILSISSIRVQTLPFVRLICEKRSSSCQDVVIAINVNIFVLEKVG